MSTDGKGMMVELERGEVVLSDHAGDRRPSRMNRRVVLLCQVCKSVISSMRMAVLTRSLVLDICCSNHPG